MRDGSRVRTRRAQRRGAATAILLLISGLTVVPTPVVGQTTASTVEGRVSDATGAFLAGVLVEAAGPSSTRTFVSDAEGFYRLTPLPPGSYTITAALQGFQTVKVEAVELPVNQTLRLDLTLPLAVQQETVVVRAESPMLDRTRAATTGRIDAQTIRSIPLNGRNYLDLLKLTPGVTINEIASTALSNRDTRGAILGERAGNTSFLVDGVDNNDDFRGGVFQDVSADAVQEFEVLSTGFRAEFGGGSGGIVNVVTRSGTNAFDGSGYFYLRDSALDASNVEGAKAPELSRKNYGITAGGPLSRDRAWFFASAEGINEDREALFASNIPELLRAGEDFTQIPGTDEYRLFGKYTQRLSPAHDLRAFVSWTRTGSLNRLAGPTSLPSTSDDIVTRGLVASAALTSTIRPSIFLETSVALRDQTYDQNRDRTDARSFSIRFIDDGSAFEFGPRLGSVQALDQTYFTAREVLNVTAGRRHALKAGVELTRTRVDGENDPGLLHVIITSRASFERFGRESFQIPQGVGFAAKDDRLTRLRNTGVTLFAQDDWQLHDNLTANLGLRYDYDSRFDAPGNAAPRVGLVWAAGARTLVRASWGRFYDRYRLGIAQAVPELGGFNGRTVVEIDYPRLAADATVFPQARSLGALALALGDPFFIHRRFGIPFDALITRDNIESLAHLDPAAFVAALNAFLRGTGAAFNPVDFSPFTGFLRQDLGAGFQDVVTVQRPFRTPRNDTFALGLQRLLGANTASSATYVHRRIRNILGVRLPNLSPDARVARQPLTTDGGPLQRVYGPWYDGSYDAFVATFERRFGGRHGVQASYTYAQSTDNLLYANLGIGLGAQGGGAVPTDNLDLEVDRGNSALAVPHTFVASGVVAAPFGLWVSGVIQATSGAYFSAAGPFIDYDGDGILSTRPRGTRRNEFRGPATHTVDLRLEYRHRIGARARASVLVELFNLTNARNPRLIENAFVSGAPVPGFGETRVPLPGREGQVGIRLEF